MTKGNMPRISLLIPVFNVERYLETCLESVRSQTLRDIEIVCIDDGSTDHSPEILAEQAKVDARIKVLTKPNGGPSSARNVGIRAALGEYLMFVDSDDCLEQNACETVYETFKQHEADVVIFGATCVPKRAGFPTLRFALSPRDAIYNAFEPALLFKEKSCPYAVRSAFRTELIREQSLYFDEGLRCGEDLAFQFMAYPCSNKTVLLSNKLYRYMVRHQGSLMSQHNRATELKLAEHLAVVRTVLLGWKERGWLTDAYAPLMLVWALDFVLIDIYLQQRQKQLGYLLCLREIFIEAFDAIDFDVLTRKPATRALLLAVLDVSKSAGTGGLHRGLLISFFWEQGCLIKSLARCFVRYLRILRTKPRSST